MELFAGKDRLLIIPDKRQETTESGLIIPPSDEKVVTGICYAANCEDPGRYQKSRVYYRKQDATDIQVIKTKYAVLNYKDVLATSPVE